MTAESDLTVAGRVVQRFRAVDVVIVGRAMSFKTFHAFAPAIVNEPETN